MSRKLNKIIISGGGTGGHIFPALAIADEIRRRYPDAEILFIGANDRMEMQRMPAAGYKIIGLPVRGLKRSLSLENISVVSDFFKSTRKAKKIIADFKPEVAIGVGGYASAPLLRAASRMKIPCLIQEQNSYAGITNKMLAKKVNKICVAYPEMERYFPKNKIVFTGNPVRQFTISQELKQKGLKHFGLNTTDPVLLVVGGSLGARTINRSISQGIGKLFSDKIQVIWQTGKYYFEQIRKDIDLGRYSNLHVYDFIFEMELAYNAADLIISRAGALSISELCLLGRSSVLVPSPNVAEDHQTKNAMALVNIGAAKMIKDIEAIDKLIDEALLLIRDENQIKKIGKQAKTLAKPDATVRIVNEIELLINASA